VLQTFRSNDRETINGKKIKYVPWRADQKTMLSINSSNLKNSQESPIKQNSTSITELEEIEENQKNEIIKEVLYYNQINEFKKFLDEETEK
jgi:hypothetical protein